MRSPFSVFEPASGETPVIVEIPHAGLAIDGPALANLAAAARSIGRDADLYVDELYEDATSCGASVLVAHSSRYLVDLNRAESDVDSESVEGAPANSRATRGVIWRLASDGSRVLDAPLPRRELERRLSTYYRPYHDTLRELIERKRSRFGFAMVLAAHSMPSVGRTAAAFASGETSGSRADVVPGTRGGRSAARSFIQAVEAHARASSLSVVHDDPYQGGFTTQHYGRPDRDVHVVQVELARRLYMDEVRLVRGAGFERTRGFCTSLVDAVGRVRP